MGPIFVAIVAVCFFALALISAVVALFFGILAFMHLVAGPSRILGAYVLGSGLAGGAVLVFIGFGMRWNVIGDAIMKVPVLGCASCRHWLRLVRRCGICRRFAGALGFLTVSSD